MYYKCITRKNHFERIASLLLEVKPNFKFDNIVNREECRQIAQLLRGTKYGYPSVIYAFINDNKEFRCFFLQNYTNLTINKRVDFSTEQLKLFLLKLGVNNVCLNYRNKNSIYKNLCNSFEFKNSLKNRLKIYRKWRTIKNNHGEVNNFNNADACTPKIDTMEHSSDICSVDNVDSQGEQLIEKVAESFEKTESVISNTSYVSSTPKNNVTPEKLSVPKDVLNLSSIGNATNILPKDSHNVSFLSNKTLCNRNCSIFEGSFNINDNVWNKIYENGKLNTKYYPYVIRNRINKYVNNTCLITFKYVKYSKKTCDIHIYGQCKHNNNKCKKFKISIVGRTADVYSTSLNYCHKIKLTHHVRGVEREIMKQKVLSMKPFNYKKHTLLESNEKLINITKNLQEIKSDTTIRKVRSEAIGELDRSKDDIMDLILMQNDHPEYIKEVSFPFNVKTYSLDQLQVLQSLATETDLPLIYFDATGGLVKKPVQTYCKRIYLYTAVVNIKKTNRIFPIFSMVSSMHDSNSIFKLLHDFRYFCEKHNSWPAFSGVVSDFSFANIHAICRAFNKCTLIEYLQQCYLLAQTSCNFQERNLIGVHLCCAHFVKMMCNDIDRFAKSNQQKHYFKDILASAILINNIKIFDVFVTNIYILLKSKQSDFLVQCALETLKNLCTEKAAPLERNIVTENESSEQYYTKTVDKSLYKSSPFYLHFKSKIESVHIISNGTIENAYFNEELFEIVFTKYLPYCPLWSALFLSVSPVSNACVENYFGQLKKLTLNSEKNLKCSQFLRKLRAEVLALKIENNLNISKIRLTKHEADDEKCSQEMWIKRSRKVESHFTARFIKSLKNSKKEIYLIYAEDDTDLQQCIYCGYGTSCEETSWVQCDRCLGWIHQKCDSSKGNKTTYSGEFVCKRCEVSLEVCSVETSVIGIYEECQSYLNKIQLSKTERIDLEIATRSQSKSLKWKEERRIRVTSSMFGRICKTQKSSSYDNILRSVTDIKDINAPSIAHGIRYENVALDQYIQSTGASYQVSGLCIDENFPFLAASPDGLIDRDGIIEIKCPFNARNIHPEHFHFDFLYEDKSLKTTHNYYYQIQGLLAITNRSWCDLVIYTFVGMKVIRILRSKTFWNKMLEKLKTFYLFYMLPEMLYPNNKLTLAERHWTIIEDLQFLNNGLVSNENYYKDIRGYVVTHTSTIQFSIKDILIDDFVTLNSRQWLSSFIIDHCLNIINHINGNLYQIISVGKSSAIFGDKVLEKAFKETFNITKNILIMPVHRNHHYIIVVINLANQTVIILDPLGLKADIEKLFMEKLRILMRILGMQNINFKLENKDHIRQTDSFNCGVYIIYYFEQFAKLSLLTDAVDINQYRTYLKLLLLKNSDDMKSKCLICSNNIDILVTLYFRCRTCKRLLHESCLRTQQEKDESVSIKDKTCNGICELCRIF